MPVLRRVLRAAALAGCTCAIVTAAAGCSGSGRGEGSPILGGSAPAPTALEATPVEGVEQAFLDETGGVLTPAPPDTAFPLTVDAVQQDLSGDGASARWVAVGDRLVVRSGIYHALVPDGPGGALSPSATGTPAYVFSGDTGPCPPSSGGAGERSSTPDRRCTGTVVADASTGAIIDVEIAPA